MIIPDDRLYQWDSGHYVTLTDDDALATQVHFAQYCSRACALIVEVTEKNGAKIAEIPNSLLVDHKRIMAWTWLDDQTISGVGFDVIPRNKPCDFIYTPTEVLNYEHLKQWLLDEFQRFEVTAATDYETLNNKPRINDVELIGNKELAEIGVDSISDEDIDSLFA